MSDLGRMRLTHEGRLATLTGQIKERRLRLQGIRSALLMELDPVDPVDGIDSEKVAEMALTFASIHTEFVELFAQAEAIRKALGR